MPNKLVQRHLVLQHSQRRNAGFLFASLIRWRMGTSARLFIRLVHGWFFASGEAGLAKPNGYLLGSYRIATAPEPNSSRLTSLKSTHFDPVQGARHDVLLCRVDRPGEGLHPIRPRSRPHWLWDLAGRVTGRFSNPSRLALRKCLMMKFNERSSL
jgi:hypothetical protein